MATNKNNSSNQNMRGWFTNVAKSLGYSLSDIAKDTMPTTFDTIETNKDFILETGKKLRRMKGRRGTIESMMSGKALANWKHIKAGVSNAGTALKTGKFYSGPQSMFDDDDLGMSFSDDLGDDSFDVSFDGDDDGGKPPVKVNVVSNINEDNPMVTGINTQTSAMISLAEMENKRELELASEHRRLTEKLHGGVGAVNENISHLVSFAHKDGASYINASLRYYEESLSHLSNISSKLDAISTSMTSANGNGASPTSPSSRVGWSDVVGSSGAFNMSNYAQMMKQNLRVGLESNMFTSSIMGLLSDSDNLRILANEPLAFIPKLVAGAIVPNVMKSTLEAFDTSFKQFIPAVLTRIGDLANKDDPTGLLEIIGNTFGINLRANKTVRLNDYEKGPVPFDGVTKKAITEVIPG